MEDLKRHEFFAGISWHDLRNQEAPDFIAPSLPTAEDEALDWYVYEINAFKAKGGEGGYCF